MKSKYLTLWVILVLSLVACNQPQSNSTKNADSSTGNIAYVNVDTLMEKYQFAKDLNEEFTKKQENMTADLNVKARKFEDMVKSFQYRLQNNGFASRTRAENEQKQIEKKRQELMELDQTLKNELSEEYQAIITRLQDTISKELELFNEKAGYDLILRTTKGGNVLYGKPELDITEEFVNQLNKGYKGDVSDDDSNDMKVSTEETIEGNTEK
ncbi:periplasmic chaperone for outer membrane proteins Skp [Balneicella halophila]|uniref:Periplasmic chaperone for outer membrane proteins Skp n=1 Tax=Balneicella halophila TaxID=1537566 RepID=A0A7L4UMQ1_BALHA|nr:OmpH family outer membrane protein [Balneicella halophila]PVX49904.1 periplasmic chaperone for outer membrane proteins Skp [Balneicella halophila]